MKKYVSNLSYYKYFASIVEKGLQVTWYVVEEDEDEEMGRGFTNNELIQFQDFVNKHPLNFEGDKNVHEMTINDNVYFPLLSYLEDERINTPTNLFLRQDSQLSEEGMAQSMDIVLTDRNGSKIEYNLDFDVVAVINY